MRRNFWNAALWCGLALSINTAGLTAHGYQAVPAGKVASAKVEDAAKGKPPSDADKKTPADANALAQRGGGGKSSG